MKYKFLLALLLAASLVYAQEDMLPRGFSEHEKALMQWENFVAPQSAVGIEEPPPHPVRHMAEWEELQALAITWRSYPEILTQIALHAAEEVKVLILCNNETVKNNAQNSLQLAGVNMANVEFIVTPNNSVWIRDYGPNCVYANEVDSLYFIDWVYNRPSRPADDASPNAIGAHLNIPVYSTTANPERLVNTGGNFMSDGQGTAFASKLILEENAPGNPYNAGPHNEESIDQIMHDYMGIDRYIKMETLPFDLIHHIDMHMRLLDEETLLVGQYPEGVADGPQIEANLQYVLNNFNSSSGTPYKVVRVVQPPDFGGIYPDNNGDYRTYTNAVFVNKTILVPGYAQQYDTLALRIYRENYPGYKVVSINCNDMIGASGALHCITKEIGAHEPLWIVHTCQEDLEGNNQLSGYEIKAQLKHQSGIAEAQVLYTTDTTQAYQALAMQPTSNPDEWAALIPHQPNGSQIYYYISATANSGKVQVRPLVAPEGTCRFTVNDVVSETEEAFRQAKLAIYPNPASAMTVVEISDAEPLSARLEVTDVFGKKVMGIFSGQLPNGSSNHFFNAGELASGVYFVTLKTAVGISTQRLVVE